MGKNKRQRLASDKNTNALKLPQGQSHPASKPNANPKPKPQAQTQHTLPLIPFSPDDRILLIGEGDLSFARSIVEHHACTNITATVLERGLEELCEKYPHVEENVAAIERAGGKVLYGADATKIKPWLHVDKEGGGKADAMDRILFNFPHVVGYLVLLYHSAF